MHSSSRTWITWLDRMRNEGLSYRQFESSISYRSPRRSGWRGMFVRKVRSDGTRRSVGLAVAAVKKRTTGDGTPARRRPCCVDSSRRHPTSRSRSREIAELVARGRGALLARLADLARDQIGTDLTWLLIVATTATFPTPTAIPPGSPCTPHLWAGSGPIVTSSPRAIASPPAEGLIDAELDIVSSAVVVDVDFCAKNAHNTGIQRVVRQTMSRWSREHDTDAGGVDRRTVNRCATSTRSSWAGCRVRHAGGAARTATPRVSSCRGAHRS